MKNKQNNEFLNMMSKDPSNWRGLFYYNRKDPRIIVPKFYPSMGYTLNFASPYAYLALGAILIIIVISILIN